MMKKILLTAALLLAVCTLTTAQRKMNFGVTIQSGNYLQAHREHSTTPYQTTDYRLTAGLSGSLGLFAERSLGKHLALFSGLNFSQSIFSEQRTTMDLYAKRQLGEGIYIHTLYFTVHQVALPVQVQVRAGRHRQLAFSMGVAPAFSLTKVNGSPESLALANPGIFRCGVGITSTYQLYYRENIPTRQLQLLYTAGLHYRPDARNALGLEFWLAPKLKEARLNPTLYGYGYYPDAYRKLYRMRSLQVSLRHSW